MRIRFANVDEFIRVDGGTRYSVFFGKHNIIHNRIRYLISKKGGIMYVFS